MTHSIPRPEHPRPDFQRDSWLNLNGEWQFAFDEDEISLGQVWYEPGYALPQKITVPFCHQSKLSGLHDKRLCPVVWYKRTFELPEGMRDKRVFLRFGAVDYRCQVYINGERAGEHVGGYTPFGFDITNILQEGVNELCVRVEDAPDCTQPRGKQYWKEGWMGCWYTPVTGIWQTVYLEAVGERFITSAHITPDVDAGTADFRLTLDALPGKSLAAEIEISHEGTPLRFIKTSVTQRLTGVSV